MERRSDVPAYLAAVAAMAIAGGIIYAAVNAATVGATDSTTPNATTQGPPASFEKP